MIINAIVDRLPRIRELAASEYYADVLRGAKQLFPDREEAEYATIVRGVLRHRAFNRAIHRFQTRFPGFALVVARFIPTTVSAEVAALVRGDRPILVAGPHIGSVFFVLTVLLRVLRGRSVYVLHSSATRFSQTNAAYLRRIGVTSVLQDQNSLRILARALRNERRCTVVIAFDHLADGRRTIEIFQTQLAVSYGTAYLADVTEAAVIVACWQFADYWPRVVFEGPYEIDRILGRAERHAQLMSRLFAFLEGVVQKSPEQWTQWQFVAEAAMRAAKCPAKKALR
jgi:lauroyl/myristoyl acyltransferase